MRLPNSRLRGLLSLVALVSLAALPAACSLVTPGTPATNGEATISINLKQAQNQAQAIDAAVAASLAAAQPAMTADQNAKALVAKAALDAAVARFAAMPNGSVTVRQEAMAVLALVGGVVDAIPVIPPQDKLLVDTGVAILDAFIANMPLTVPAPTGVVVAAG